MNDSAPNSPKAFLRRAAEALDKSPLKDMQRNARALAQSAAWRLDLVSRDEFDALQAVLAAASARIAQLEAQVAALEAQAASHTDSPASP
ncbi:membrane fusogenic activity [mine drainage metagenome]|uniref:Membrane fusogenic activity n=1 Tax=mine drainage metagenome TaxID=410659 RepID=A0A1J5R5T3_9ZZZZ